MEQKNKKLGQEPAFPVDGQYALDALNSNNGGISKRLLIAKDIAASLFTGTINRMPSISEVVRISYQVADELLKQENENN